MNYSVNRASKNCYPYGKELNPYLKLYTGIPHFILLCRYCIFFKLEVLWQPCLKQSYGQHFFSTSICLLHVSVSHFGNFHNFSNFIIFITLFLLLSSYPSFWGNCIEVGFGPRNIKKKTKKQKTQHHFCWWDKSRDMLGNF